jgi:hypothetical protein
LKIKKIKKEKIKNPNEIATVTIAFKYDIGNIIEVAHIKEPVEIVGLYYDNCGFKFLGRFNPMSKEYYIDEKDIVGLYKPKRKKVKKVI